MDFSKLEKLSDDMIGQLYLNARRILMQRDVNINDVCRNQLKRGDHVVFRNAKDDGIVHGRITAINMRTASIQLVSEHSPTVDVPGKWKADFSLLVSLGPVVQTRLAGPAPVIKPHVMKTDVQDTW